MAKANSTLTWSEIDPATLPAHIQEAYGAYKVAYAAMKEKRQVFEQSMNDVPLPEGKRIVCGYNFGKLSIALADDDRKPAKAQASKGSLADFIAAQTASGRRA